MPTVWLGLVEHLDATGGDVPTLERIVVGGAPMPPALMAADRAPAGRDGADELGDDRALARRARSRRRTIPRATAALSGRPAVGVDLLLTDADGRPLARAARRRRAFARARRRGGRALFRRTRSPRPTRTAGSTPAISPGSTRDGNLIITGRAKDLIKSGGEWINPAEIEAVVGALPEVALAAVIGRPDPKWGERPILLVEMRDGQPISDEALLEPLRGRVASWWIPDAVFRLSATCRWRRPARSTRCA